ncbi:MAG: copper amine oxidase N-terminal domain-containing protein, partial [Bacteroidales bacterium]|nr:copper amine oxidase N-terminal domain-containing protein [Bacteroidales bacterium]
MKKILSILMLSFTLLLSFSMVAFAGDISVNVNGQPLAFQEKPIVKNGRTLVPMREIFEVLGAELNWDAGTKTITAKKDGTEIKMQIGSKDITIGNETKTLDVEPQIINGRTMVPVRAISEALGTKVVYNEKNQ